jgi:hypothetical protein
MLDENLKLFAQAGAKVVSQLPQIWQVDGTDIILGGNINFKIQKKLYDILTLSKNYTLSKKTNIFQSQLISQFEGISQKFLSVLYHY